MTPTTRMKNRVTKRTDGSGRILHQGAPGSRASGFGMSTEEPSLASVTLIVGPKVSAIARPAMATMAIRLNDRHRPSGSRPLGNTSDTPARPMNTRIQPHPFAHAAAASAGVSVAARSASSVAVTGTFPMARPQPVIISSQPIGFDGRRTTR